MRYKFFLEPGFRTEGLGAWEFPPEGLILIFIVQYIPEIG